MIAFTLWPITVYRYGIMYLLGFIAAYTRFWYIGKRRWLEWFPWVHRILTQKLDNLFIAIVLAVLVGGRLWHVFIYDRSYFVENPLKIFAVNEWGMSFIGGIVWVSLIMTVLLRVWKVSRKERLALFDVIVSIVPFGIMVGRIGNFLNQELYGIVYDSVRRGFSSSTQQFLESLNILYVYSNIDEQLRVNTNFLASFSEWFLLLVVLQWAFWISYKKKPRAGMLTGLFLAWYSLVRFILEFIRQDSQFEIERFLSRSQWFFVLFFIVGVVVYALAAKTVPRNS